jgi:L-threonylcarbamoyladenylate synthase
VLNGLAGRIDAVLDSGPCAIGIESTVLDLSGTEPVLLRPGSVMVDDLEARIGPIVRAQPHTVGGAIRSPGLMASHYAPSLPVRLDATSVADDEALLAFGPPLRGGRCQFQLSESGSSTEAAAHLFEGLRRLDADGVRLGASRIAVMPVPDSGLGSAINDRLQRAAAPRVGS